MSVTASRASADAPDLPVAGDRIGHYELIRQLGRGGMGTVFLARDTKLGRRAAIKFLHSNKEEVTARFLIEARATAQCQHENIVIIYEVGEHRGQPYMVLEYLQGSPLSKLLKGRRKLAPGRAVELMVPVVRALEKAHEHNIVHRDLKPDNIFVTETGAVKVLDFGIAKLIGDEPLPVPDPGPGNGLGATAPARHGLPERSSTSTGATTAPLTQQGAFVGTLKYMSPEQWGADTVDHQTDLWAVGLILFEMVAGRRPLSDRSGWGLGIVGVLTEPMPSVREACPEVPENLAAVIDYCLAKPKRQRVSSARELLMAMTPLLPGRRTRTFELDVSPYAGLRAFQESDASHFFGRAREVTAAAARLREQPLLGVIGPSGAGKSSFVRAGVIPALKQSGESWSSIVIRPGREPLAALANAIAPMLGQASQVSQVSTTASGIMAEHAEVVSKLRAEPGYCGTVLRHRAREGGRNLVLFVDQFEELYTLCHNVHERLAFTACLASVADDATTPLRVVLSIRSDFLDRVSEDAHFTAELARGLFFLAAPQRDALQAALIEPAELAGYEFESQAMVDNMLEHLAETKGALPMLQFTAARLWDLRDRQRKLLTEASYQSIGGVAGALASHADAVIAGLPKPAQALARSLFLRLVTPERTRAVVSVRELYELAPQPAHVDALVEHLVGARLLVVQSGEGDTGADVAIEIVHESLLERWPLLRRWLDENQDDALFLEQLRSTARQWHARGRPVGLLWTGEAMDEARRWHRRYRGPLPDGQRAYLHAVFALAARAARRRRWLVVGVIACLSLLVAAAGVALVVIRDAQQEATEQAAVAKRAETVARDAEGKVREQLAQVQAAQKRQRTAEAEARAALSEAQTARAQVEQVNGELSSANESLSSALDTATAARQRERAAAWQARQSAQDARVAEGDARRSARELAAANAELEELVRERDARIRRLEAQRGVIVRTVAVTEGE